MDKDLFQKGERRGIWEERVRRRLRPSSAVWKRRLDWRINQDKEQEIRREELGEELRNFPGGSWNDNFDPICLDRI